MKCFHYYWTYLEAAAASVHFWIQACIKYASYVIYNYAAATTAHEILSYSENMVELVLTYYLNSNIKKNYLHKSIV